MTRPEYSPKTRLEGRQRVTEIDADTGGTWVTGRTRSGRLIDKNRDDGWRGYKSHITPKNRRFMRWALRQRDRGHSRQKVVDALLERGYTSGPMQYPLTRRTIAGWELTRRAEAKKGRQWP